jgi:2-hydroxychromene-2-carboxylate isomerase
MGSEKQPVEFFFDFSSPYAYIANHLVDALGAKYDRAVIWRPVLLGAIFKLTGMAPLTQIPIKGDYAMRDFPRTAAFHGAPFQMPDPFPFNSIAAARAFYWLDRTDPEAARLLAGKLFASAYGGRAINSADSVAAIAGENGIDSAALLAGIESPAVKERTRAENEEAIKRGVFGSPFLIVDGEAFWGVDRLDQAERWLETGGW